MKKYIDKKRDEIVLMLRRRFVPDNLFSHTFSYHYEGDKIVIDRTGKYKIGNEIYEAKGSVTPSNH